MRESRTHAAYAALLRVLPANPRALLKATLAVPQIASVGIRPLEWLTPAPSCQTVSFACNGTSIVADLYALAGHDRRAAIVMTLGANDAGARDPRAIALANVLARSGFRTLVVVGAPGMVSMDALDPYGLLDAPSVTAAAFDYLQQQPDVDARRIGLLGVCFGGSACLLAAARADLARRVAIVFVIGPYYSLRDLLRAALTGRVRTENGAVRSWSAEPWARERARDWLIGVLSPADRRAVKAALAQSGAGGPTTLSPQAQAVVQLTNGVAPDVADGLIDALGDTFVDALRAASPADQLDGLCAETYVMHGTGDVVVPVDESRRLVAALRRRTRVRYAEFDLFEHVDATRPLGPRGLAREAWRLVQHARPLMRVAG